MSDSTLLGSLVVVVQGGERGGEQADAGRRKTRIKMVVILARARNQTMLSSIGSRIGPGLLHSRLFLFGEGWGQDQL